MTGRSDAGAAGAQIGHAAKVGLSHAHVDTSVVDIQSVVRVIFHSILRARSLGCTSRGRWLSWYTVSPGLARARRSMGLGWLDAREPAPISSTQRSAHVSNAVPIVSTKD